MGSLPEGHDRRRLGDEGRRVRRSRRRVDPRLRLTVHPSIECDLSRAAGQVAFIQAYSGVDQPGVTS